MAIDTHLYVVLRDKLRQVELVGVNTTVEVLQSRHVVQTLLQPWHVERREEPKQHLASQQLLMIHLASQQLLMIHLASQQLLMIHDHSNQNRSQEWGIFKFVDLTSQNSNTKSLVKLRDTYLRPKCGMNYIDGTKVIFVSGKSNKCCLCIIDTCTFMFIYW